MPTTISNAQELPFPCFTAAAKATDDELELTMPAPASAASLWCGENPELMQNEGKVTSAVNLVSGEELE